MRIAAIIAAVVVLSGVVVIGLQQATSENGGQETETVRAPSASEAQRRLAGSPPALAAIHAQAGELLPGGPAALAERLRELRGYPVVVNVWSPGTLAKIDGTIPSTKGGQTIKGRPVQRW